MIQGSGPIGILAVAAAREMGASRVICVGAPEKPLPVAAFPLIFRRRSFSGSLIGGLPETQEMLDFCAAKGVVAARELVQREKVAAVFGGLIADKVLRGRACQASPLARLAASSRL